ncbi:hypothetical protein KUV65_11965 [Maritalea mobilis]|uniref:hypothetical protein n=1 Tax=Maritalea mobilis TaxID=483324 RepID=UPI001C94BE41|nr:hypothetical protein [Maritalea mobilis]MBY6202083.1 hypothetical protein [Maritalea mobilis]
MTYKTPLFAAICAAGLLGPVPSAVAQDHAYNVQAQRQVITISCYRGPWDDVIWDRPNPQFTDSLVAAGYTLPEAHAIGERVCRDPSTVHNPDGMIAVLNQIIAQSPPGRR